MLMCMKLPMNSSVLSSIRTAFCLRRIGRIIGASIRLLEENDNLGHSHEIRNSNANRLKLLSVLFADISLAWMSPSLQRCYCVASLGLIFTGFFS